MNVRRALIDGDILVYRTGFAGQQTLVSAVLADGTVVVDSAKNATECRAALVTLGIPETDVTFTKEVHLDAPGHVAHSLDVQLEYILDTVQTREHDVFITGSGNYREAIATVLPYKGNRVSEKPAYYDFLRERLQRRWKAHNVQGAEADDLLAICGTEGPNSIICTIDKDLRQVPGLHLNWVKSQDITYVDPAEGAMNLFTQVLCGDTTDNIPNVCKGFGPKTAAEYLISQNCRTWQDYCDACARKYEEVHGIGGIKRMIEIFTLVYMCRTEQELTLAKQVASQGGTGLSPTTVAAAEQYMSFMRACN